MSQIPRQLHLRVFLASPGDVVNERTLARKVVDDVQYDARWRGLVTLETIAWDTPGAVPMIATATPQASVAHRLPKPSECDIVVVIFWARVGTPLPPQYTKPDGTAYASGTEWEYLDAFDAAVRTGRPRLLVYRRLEKLAVYASDPETREKLRQWEWVQSFFAQFRGEDGSLCGGYNPYKTPDEFRRQFEGHLRSLIYDFANSREFVPADSLARRPQVPMWQGSPFPGLRSFTPADEPIFFGRGAEIDGIVRRFDENSRFLGIIGSSGSGKSSLVAAGLIPRLQRNALEGSRRWVYVRFTPGGADGDPFKALAASLSQKLVRESSGVDEWATDTLTAKLAEGRSTAAETLERVVEQMQATKLLLFIDQFEELFTVATASSPGQFVQLLTAAVRSSRVRVLITVRADFYDRCIEIPELAELLGKGSYPLAAPGFESLLEMITKPADRAGVTFEEELPGRILNDVGSDAGALPLMAFALNGLFETREVSGRLTHRAYDGFGGLRGAIVNRAEEVMDTVAASLVTGGAAGPAVGADVRAQVEHALTQIFRELVDVGEGRNPTKRRVPMSRVTASDVSLKLVRSLVDARLLVATGGVDPIHGGAADPMIEVAHEALFTHWRRVRDWVEGVRDDLRLRSQLQRAAVEWNEHKEDPAYTWSDERCVDAHRRLQQLSYEPTELERRFLGPLNIDLMLNEINDPATTPERRALIGVRLALLGDPRFGTGLHPNGLPDIEWCAVEGGIVLSGEQRTERQVAPFKIAKHPLTWAQFGVFVRSHDGYSNRVWWEGLGAREEQPGRQSQRYLNHPVDNVSWVDATAYCRWLTSRLGHEVRLPTQWEWQLVASGGDPSRPFPWGEWELGRANTREHQLDRTTAVGMFPHGAAPCGALDVCGNVWEWCSDGEDLYPPDGNCPAGYRAVRGGSWNFGHETARSDVPNVECSAYRFNSVGFRVACT